MFSLIACDCSGPLFIDWPAGFYVTISVLIYSVDVDKDPIQIIILIPMLTLHILTLPNVYLQICI